MFDVLSHYYIGSYAVFDHVKLYGENSPCLRPVVLYKGEAPMKEFKGSQAVACDVLTEPEGEYEKAPAGGRLMMNRLGPHATPPGLGEEAVTGAESATPGGLIEANRVGAEGKKVKTKDVAPLVKSSALKSDRVMALAAGKKVCHF